MVAPQSERHPWQDDSSAPEMPPGLVLPCGPLDAKSWTEALYELEGALAQLMEALDAYLVVNVTRHDDIFVQYHTSSLGAITAETAATRRCSSNCMTRHLVGDYEAGQLRTLGWKAPNLDPLQTAIPGSGHPNFYRTWSTDNGWPPALFSDLTVRTLYEVWHLGPRDCTMRSAALPAGLAPGNH